MKHLHDLEAAEVSLVPKGANKRKFLIFKSREGNSMDKELVEMIRKGDPKAVKRVEKVLKDYCDMAEKSEEGGMMDDRAMAALKAAARILTPFKDKLPGDLVGKVMNAAGMQMSGEEMNDSNAPEREENSLTKELGSMSPEQVKDEHEIAAMKSATDAYNSHLQKLGYQKYPEGKLQMKSAESEEDGETEEDESVSKTAVVKADGSLDLSAVSESVRPAIQAIYKSHQELVQKNAALEKKMADQASAVREKEIVAKAASFKNLGLAHEEVVQTLKDADSVGTEAFTRVCKQFETLETQAAQGGLFREIGSNQSSKGRTTYEAIEKAAEGMVAKSGESLSKAEGIDKFLKTELGGRMYVDYQREMGRI